MNNLKFCRGFVWIYVLFSVIFPGVLADELPAGIGSPELNLILSSESKTVSPGDEFFVNVDLKYDKFIDSDNMFDDAEIEINFSNDLLMFSDFQTDFPGVKIVKTRKTMGELKVVLFKDDADFFEKFSADSMLRIGKIGFKVKKRATNSKSEVIVKSCDFINNKGDKIDCKGSNFSIEIFKQPCLLKDLKCREGVLTPSFNPEVFEYKMNVPSETTDVFLEAVGSDESHKIRINRHKLFVAGKPTEIKVLVSGGMTSEKSVYKVIVERERPKKILAENNKSTGKVTKVAKQEPLKKTLKKTSDSREKSKKPPKDEVKKEVKKKECKKKEKLVNLVSNKKNSEKTPKKPPEKVVKTKSGKVVKNVSDSNETLDEYDGSDDVEFEQQDSQDLEKTPQPEIVNFSEKNNRIFVIYTVVTVVVFATGFAYVLYRRKRQKSVFQG